MIPIQEKKEVVAHPEAAQLKKAKSKNAGFKTTLTLKRQMAEQKALHNRL